LHFGPRFAKKTTEPLVVDAGAAPAAPQDELIEWKYGRHDGGEDDSEVVQTQRIGGRVQYDMEKEALAIVLDKGPEIYYVDKNDQLVEVDATHDDAERRERNGGKLKIQIEIDGAAAACLGHLRPRAGSRAGRSSRWSRWSRRQPYASAQPSIARCPVASCSRSQAPASCCCPVSSCCSRRSSCCCPVSSCCSRRSPWRGGRWR